MSRQTLDLAMNEFSIGLFQQKEISMGGFTAIVVTIVAGKGGAHASHQPFQYQLQGAPLLLEYDRDHAKYRMTKATEKHTYVNTAVGTNAVFTLPCKPHAR